MLKLLILVLSISDSKLMWRKLLEEEIEETEEVAEGEEVEEEAKIEKITKLLKKEEESQMLKMH